MTVPPGSGSRQIRLARSFVLATSYAALGWFGLLLAVPPGYATAIFPPAGLAVGAMFLIGSESLPATFVGSFVLNAIVGFQYAHRFSAAVFGVAVLIAATSTLQAGVGGWALRGAAGRPATFDSARDVSWFLLLAPLICLISSTLSQIGLWYAGVLDSANFATSWLTWWVGDTLGVLIVVPLMLVAVGEPRALWRRRARFVAVPMMFFFALFVAIFVRVSRWEAEQSLGEFRLRSQQLADELKSGLEAQAAFLEQLRASFVTRHYPVSQSDFHQLAAVLLQRFPAVQAVEWAPRVTDIERAAFEASKRGSIGQFSIRERSISGELKPSSLHPDYYPVAYAEPFERNRVAIGYDLSSEMTRRQAIAQAIIFDHVAATGPIRLVQEPGNEAGCLLIVWVPSGPTGPGLVLTALRMGSFVGATFAPLSASIDGTLIDADSGKPLYSSFPADPTNVNISQFNFGGRSFVLKTSPTPAYMAQHRGWESWALLVAGVFGTGLIGALLMLGTGQTWRFQSLLDERTHDLKLSHQRLENEMREREAAQSALHQAQRIEAIGQLTGGIAHDFNNLLMVVSGSVERLRKNTDAGKAEKYLDHIQAAAKRGEGLTRQLLSFAQLRPLKAQVVDLAQVTRNTADMLRQSLRGDIELKLDIADSPCPAEVDPGEFELAVLNLAINGQDAMPDGGTLSISLARTQLDGSIDALRGHYVGVTVSDAGQGISPEILPRVFEPFFTTKEIGKGTGLGLSQVYGFAKQSGGTVTIRSAPQEGTHVTLLLPSSDKSPVSATTERSDPVPGSMRGNLLVVEDNIEVSQILIAQLEDVGYRVARASDARSALQMLSSGESFEIVLSDILMPGGMNGVELARRIRADRPEVAVVLITGYSGDSLNVDNEGLTVLRKPFDIATLQKAIASALATGQARVTG